MSKLRAQWLTATASTFVLLNALLGVAILGQIGPAYVVWLILMNWAAVAAFYTMEMLSIVFSIPVEPPHAIPHWLPELLIVLSFEAAQSMIFGWLLQKIHARMVQRRVKGL